MCTSSILDRYAPRCPLQLAVRYNMPAELAPPQYDVACEWYKDGVVRVKATCSLPKPGPTSADPCQSMAIVQCGLFTGYMPVRSSLDSVAAASRAESQPLRRASRLGPHAPPVEAGARSPAAWRPSSYPSVCARTPLVATRGFLSEHGRTVFCRPTVRYSGPRKCRAEGRGQCRGPHRLLLPS